MEQDNQKFILSNAYQDAKMRTNNMRNKLDKIEKAKFNIKYIETIYCRLFIFCEQRKI